MDTTHDKINKESSVVTKTSYREVTQNQNDSKDLRQRLTRRRKIATEPNSPTNDISDHARQFGFHN